MQETAPAAGDDAPDGVPGMLLWVCCGHRQQGSGAVRWTGQSRGVSFSKRGQRAGLVSGL